MWISVTVKMEVSQHSKERAADTPKEVRPRKEPLGLQTGRSCGSVHAAMLGGVGSSS